MVNTYTAFDELPEHERTFIDEYIVSIGDRLMAQADQRRGDPKNDKVVQRLIAKHVPR